MTAADTATAILGPDGRPAAARASAENPQHPLTSQALVDALGLQPAAAGVPVDEETSLGLTSVWAAVQLLASAVAMLPFGVYEPQGDQGRERIDDHPADRLLNLRPNEVMIPQVLKEAITANALLYGRGFGWIERDGMGEPVGLHVLPSSRTGVVRRRGVARVVTTINGQRVNFRLEDVLHLPGLTLDGLVGLSPIHTGRDAVAVGLAAERFGGSFFANGSQLSGTLEHPNKISKEAAARLRESWERMHAGARNAFRAAVLEEGMKFNSTGVEPEKAQLLETRRFSVTEVARLFGVPPHLIADLERATFSNIEHQGIAFVTYSLNRWVLRWEQEVRLKLFNERDQTRLRAKLDTNALLRGDSKQRADFYARMSEIGALTINEIRALEDLPSIGPAGNVPRVTKQTEPLGTPEDDAPEHSTPDEINADNPDETDADEERAGRAPNPSGAASGGTSGGGAWLRREVDRLLRIETDRLRGVARKATTAEAGLDAARFIGELGPFFARHREHAARELRGPLPDAGADRLAERLVDGGVLGATEAAHAGAARLEDWLNRRAADGDAFVRADAGGPIESTDGDATP